MINFSWIAFVVIIILITMGCLVVFLCINVFANAPLKNTENSEQMNASALHSESGKKQNDDLVKPDDLQCLSDEPEYSLLPNPTIKKGTIFVSIASYRDDECSNTVTDLYKFAKNPDLIFVGAVEQNKPGVANESCIYSCPDCKKRVDSGQIRIQKYTDQEARGPSWARWAASKLWNGEEFFLMIDSHSYFEKDWDENLIKQWEKIQNPKAIITSYPPTKDQMASMKKNNWSTTCANCAGTYDNGIFKAKAAIITLKQKETPQKIPFVAAGFFFAPYTYLYDNMWDPWSGSYVFFAEESLMALGAYKAGYDFYAPYQHVIAHNYGRPSKPKFFSNKKWAKCKDLAESRAKYQLGLHGIDKVHENYRRDIDKYYNGTVRTAQQYLDWIKFDPIKKTVGINLC